jgi:hypothetical protein
MTALPLLFGPSRAPRLRRGDRAACLFRDADVVITSWTAARLPWPRCRLADGHGGSGLLVDEELARAVRRESSLAIQHWFGVSMRTVWCWRRTFGVTQWGTEGSRLHQELSAAGAAKARENNLPEGMVRQPGRGGREGGALRRIACQSENVARATLRPEPHGPT